VSSAVHAFDDTHLPTVTHPTGPVAAALLALSQVRSIPGRDLLHALILGMEMECRMSNVLIAPPAEGDERWLMTGLTGTIGAAVAAGRALRLKPAELVWAIGTAVQQAGGLREGHATMGHSFPIGHAARCGLFAALLAQRGFTGAERAIEGPRGFARMYASRPCLEALTRGWGQHYELLLNAIKPYPCGIVAHAAIDAAIEVSRAGSVDVQSIDRIWLDVNPLAIELTGRPSPSNSFEVPYSMHHWVASALLYGAPDLRHRSEAAIQDPEVVRLRAKVVARPNPDCARDEASICVRLRDGTELRAHVPHARGSIERPLTDAELVSKFHGQADPVIGRSASLEVIEACWRVERLNDAAGVPRAAAMRRH
jgi:2-methylcitrate dehydratase PrpD